MKSEGCWVMHMDFLLQAHLLLQRIFRQQKPPPSASIHHLKFWQHGVRYRSEVGWRKNQIPHWYAACGILLAQSLFTKQTIVQKTHWLAAEEVLGKDGSRSGLDSWWFCELLNKGCNSTESDIQYPVINYKGKDYFKKEWLYMHNWITLLYRRN